MTKQSEVAKLTNEFSPDWATHPGDHLKEHLAQRGMSLSDLARATNLSKAYLSDVLKHRRSIGVRVALRLEQVFGLAAHVWLGLQANWDLNQARRSEQDALDQ